jgi:hypothetical protein
MFRAVETPETMNDITSEVSNSAAKLLYRPGIMHRSVARPVGAPVTRGASQIATAMP